MARSTTVSLRALCASEDGKQPGDHFIYIYTNVKQLFERACTSTVHRTRVATFASNSPAGVSEPESYGESRQACVP